MTTPSANPRRFSRGTKNLDPATPLSIFFSLSIPTDETRDTSFKAVARINSDWPQARVRPVGLSNETGITKIIFEIGMGEVRDALKGTSVEAQAGYGFLFSVCKNLFHLRPSLSNSPTPEESELIEVISCPDSVR